MGEIYSNVRNHEAPNMAFLLSHIHNMDFCRCMFGQTIRWKKTVKREDERNNAVKKWIPIPLSRDLWMGLEQPVVGWTYRNYVIGWLKNLIFCALLNRCFLSLGLTRFASSVRFQLFLFVFCVMPFIFWDLAAFFCKHLSYLWVIQVHASVFWEQMSGLMTLCGPLSDLGLWSSSLASSCDFFFLSLWFSPSFLEAFFLSLWSWSVLLILLDLKHQFLSCL